MAGLKLLEGTVILDLTQYVASSFATRILADFGAEILKVERYPLGDLIRVTGTGTVGDSNVYFLNTGVGKKSLCVDLHHPEGVELVKALVPHADAVAEGFTAGQTKKYGLDYESIRQIKPDIVYCSMSGFGQYGPHRDWVSLAPVAEAYSGLYWMTGEPDGPPQRSDTGIGDTNAAVHGCLALLAALLFRQRTGIGQYVDTAMADSMIYMDCNGVPVAAVTGEKPMRGGRHRAATVPHGIFDCAGEYVVVCVIGYGPGSMWGRFCQAIGRPEMVTDPRFDNPAHRAQNRDEVIRIVQEWFDRQPSAAQAVEYLQGYRIACSVVMRPDQLISDPQVTERQLIKSVYHPAIGREAPVLVTPYKFSETPITVDQGAPLLGQHNEYILGRYLSLDDGQIKELYRRQVIHQDPRVGELRAKGKI